MSAEPRYERFTVPLAVDTLCLDCGAAVTDRKAHTRFHAILGDHGRAVAMLMTTHIAPSVHDKYDVKERFDAKRNTNNWSAEAFDEVAGTRPNSGVDTSDPNDHGIIRRLP